MPIRPENKQRYPSNWPEIRARILARAQDKCERCAAPNGDVVARSSDGTYMLAGGEVFDEETGQYCGMARGSEYPVVRFTRIVLTIAHLDHVPEHSDDENLQALCQRCHLAYDAEHHKQTAYATRRAGRAAGDLFDGAVA